MVFKNVDWSNIDFRTSAFLLSWHLIVLIGLPIYLAFRTPSTGLIITTVVLLFATGMSITAGYHRLYAHRAFKSGKVAEFLLLLFGSMSMQSHVPFWAHKHRIHHRFVDTDKDPHNINKSFFHAHIGWLFLKQGDIDWNVIPDLKENKMVMFQMKYYHYLAFGLNIVAFLIMGFIFADFWGAFIIGWWTRVAFLSHSTYFINSLAHTFGDKSYSREQTAVNNAIVALLTFGEGYHNYHHVFASDYRNGVRWYQYDPTKWMIWFWYKVGMVSDLQKIESHLSKRRIIQEDKYIFLEALKKSTSEKREALERRVHSMSEGITDNLTKIRNYINEYRELKKNKESKMTLKSKKDEIKSLETSVKKDWKSWLKLGREVNRVAPLAHHHV